MFRKIPYRGWLLGALLLWGITAAYYSLHSLKMQPSALAQRMESDLSERQKALDRLLKEEDLLERMFSGTLSAKEVKELADAPYYLYAFEGDQNLLFWNNNRIIGTCAPDSIQFEDGILMRENGLYLKRCIPLPPHELHRIVALLPVYVSYPIQNQYLYSHYTAASYIPKKTEITVSPQPGSFPIRDVGGKTLFYVTFDKDGGSAPDAWLILFLLSAIAFSVAWINLAAHFLNKKKSPVWGILTILTVAVITLTLLHRYGLPLGLNLLPLFSSRIYASSEILSSLGMLLIYLLFSFWVVFFSVYHLRVPEKIFRGKLTSVFALAGCALLIFLSCGAVSMIRSVVIDSRISFSVSNINAINGYTLAGMFLIALLLCTVVILTFFINNLLNAALPRIWIKYIFLAATSVCAALLFKLLPCWQYITFAWTAILLLLLDYGVLRNPSSVRRNTLIPWLIFFSLSAGTALAFFTQEKELQEQRVFAETITRQRDDMLEYLFDDIGNTIQNSHFLYNYLQRPREDYRITVNERFSTRHLKGQLIKYQVDIYFYDRNGFPVYNKDTFSLSYFHKVIAASLPTYNPYLFFRETATDGHYYIASLPVTGPDSSTAGTIVLDMKLKTAINEAVYPELLQPGKIIETQKKNTYSYAVYTRGKMVTQTDDYPFPLYTDTDTLAVGQMSIQYGGDYPIMHYKTDPETLVSILDNHNHWLGVVTLFSSMLVMFTGFMLIAMTIQVLFRFIYHKERLRELTRMNLRTRIMLAIPGIVLVSFIIISGTTIWILIRQYENNGKEKLRSQIRTAEQALYQYIREKGIVTDPAGFYTEASTSAFRHFIVTLANTQRIDLNVYDIYGSLMATSQEDIYNKGFLARIMMPNAYYRLMGQGEPLLTLKEHIGKLEYVSGYVPLRNETGGVMGYVNVPFFSSQRELYQEISGVLVALINLYAFIFFLSGLAAVLISNMLTKGLKVITSRIRQFRLTGNEHVYWPHRDEIGLLIEEYNNMLEKVAAYTKALAETERESAWREMAKQVAHEIKNPLTPMKLNIQYLQHALKGGRTDIRELTQATTASLLEQIENLARIASAFSDFAKMPEAVPETICLNELLESVSSLYKNHKALRITYKAPVKLLFVYADRSQLLRVCTNLLKNAAEAIPEDREGLIDIRLEETGQTALLSIQDNGNGIPETLTPKLFSPYFTTKGSGTGLGLAMSRKIIEFWKGKIWFESEEGHGTVFYIEIPLQSL